jgi:hypothetical protein
MTEENNVKKVNKWKPISKRLRERPNYVGRMTFWKI